MSTVQAYIPAEAQHYSATIVPISQVDVAFKSGGYVQSIKRVKGVDGRMRDLQAGDRIRKGAVLAQIRPDERRDEVQQAEAEQAKASAVLEKATADFGRASRLFAKQSLTQPEYDAAKAQLETAKAGLLQAQAVAQHARISLQDCTLLSPISGWVLKRNVEIGSFVASGAAAFSIADTRFVKAVFGVPDIDVQRVKLGASQTLRTESVSRSLAGRITAISPSADPRTRVYTVEVTVDNARGELRPGMIASLVLNESASPRLVPVIPLSAVVKPPDDSSAFAVYAVDSDNGRTVTHLRKVELGDMYGNSIAITRGLKVGDLVVQAGATMIHDGETVKAIR